MYNITDTDLEFKQLLEPKLKEFEGQFERNMFTQEATLEMIYEGVNHSDFNDFKNNRLIWNAACYVKIVSYDLKVIAKNLTFSKREWEKRYFAKTSWIFNL